MQFIVISHQLWEIFVAFCIGLCLGCLYDAVRFVRRFLRPFRCEVIFANLLDILFFIFAGAVYCVFLYALSNGRFRWFTLFGLTVGYFLYTLLPSRLIRPILFFLADKLNVLLSLVMIPFKKLFCGIKKLLLIICRSVRRRHLLLRTENYKKELCSIAELCTDKRKL